MAPRCRADTLLVGLVGRFSVEREACFAGSSDGSQLLQLPSIDGQTRLPIKASAIRLRRDIREQAL
jgi:hypothetical protein